MKRYDSANEVIKWLQAKYLNSTYSMEEIINTFFPDLSERDQHNLLEWSEEVDFYTVIKNGKRKVQL